jgi:polyisoprenoid-binding protein YceI
MALKLKTMAAICIGLVSMATIADAKLAGAESAEVAFTAVGPGGLKIEGKGTELSLGQDADRVTIVVPLANLKTGIALRDKHMRENYLEVAKFPNAELSVARSALTLPAADGATSGRAEGAMTMHGQSRRVSFRYDAKRAGTRFDVAGDVRINMNDFGIRVPSYLGVTVNPDVTIAVKFSTQDR